MIDYYILKHSQGITFYYENNSPRFQLKESIMFELYNCRIEGLNGTGVAFTLNPKEKYFINIIKDDFVDEFEAKISKITYEVASESDLT